MYQQIIAFIIVLFFLFRLAQQKKVNSVSQTEFILWLFFWFLASLIIIFIKKIDSLVALLGFSSGINVLLYLSITILFYLLLRVRIKIEKMERDITRLVREISLNKKQ